MHQVVGTKFTHLLNLEDITGNDLSGLDLLQSTVTEDDSLESKSLLEFLDDRTSLVFLDETDRGVEQEQGANDTEIDPILETSSQNSSSLESNELAQQILISQHCNGVNSARSSGRKVCGDLRPDQSE